MAEQETLYQKALAAIQTHQMLRPGDRVVVGVSGGADSVALLDLLCRLEGLEITVCHLNHGLRPEAGEEEAFVRRLAEDRGLAFLSRRADAAAWARDHRCTVEEAGRELRYALFRDCSGEGGKIATAHTLSDSMETVLWNLTRGTGIKGLRGIPAVRGNIVRPLITCTRREVEDYCRQRGLSFVTDPTNLTSQYSRGRIRNRVIPQLEELNPGLPAAMARLMARMEDQLALTRELAAAARKDLDRDGWLDREGLLALPPPVREELLLDLLMAEGQKQSARLLEEMLEVLRRGKGKVQVGTGVFFSVKDGLAGLVTHRPRPGEFFPRELDLSALALPVSFPLGGGKELVIRRVTEKKREKTEKINKSALNNRLDCGRIIGTIRLRAKAPGDRMAPAWRRAGSHPLKKLCQEAGIPPEQRQFLAVAEDSRGIIWAERLGADRRCAWQEDSTAGFVFEIAGTEDGKNGES